MYFLQPVTTYAQIENIPGLIFAFGNLFDNLIVVAFGLALLVFLWGLAVFVLNAGNESKLADGRRLMFWGIIFLFILTSVWGIVRFLQITFGVQDPNAPIEGGIDDPGDIPPFGGPGPASA